MPSSATGSGCATRRASRSGSSAASPSGSARTSCAGASTAWTARPDGSYELIDYKTGKARTEEQLQEDVQLSVYQMGARESWQLETSAQSYFYVMTGEKVPVEHSEEQLERVRNDHRHDRRRHHAAGVPADALA